MDRRRLETSRDASACRPPWAGVRLASLGGRSSIGNNRRSIARFRLFETAPAGGDSSGWLFYRVNERSTAADRRTTIAIIVVRIYDRSICRSLCLRARLHGPRSDDVRFLATSRRAPALNRLLRPSRLTSMETRG